MVGCPLHGPHCESHSNNSGLTQIFKSFHNSTIKDNPYTGAKPLTGLSRIQTSAAGSQV